VHLDSFMIAGIALEVGIGPTVRHALDLNLCPVFVTEAGGSKTAAAHEQTMGTLRDTGEVFACSSSEVLSAMKREQRPGMRLDWSAEALRRSIAASGKGEPQALAK